MSTRLQDRAKRAAADQLQRLRGPDVFRPDRPLYVRRPADNLIPGVSLADFEADLDAADGNELRDGRTKPAKFCAAYSSSALAVNAFAPFKARPKALTLAGLGGFTAPLRFERKCPNGLLDENGQPARAPNLDLLVPAGDAVVAVESKFLEPLGSKKQALSAKYELPFVGAESTRPIAGPAWTALYRVVAAMKDQKPKERPFRHLDAAQLVKHYLGLKVSFPQQPRTLVYLYWEPTNAAELPEFIRHRAEVADFAARVERCDTRFFALSYAALWQEWETNTAWPDLRTHLVQLRDRYAFPIAI
jgi:hypothetical protein